MFIAGATGVLGRRLVERFRGAGHDVVGLSRDAAGDEAIESRGGEARRADLFDRNSLIRAAEDAEVVVHAATAIPETARPADADWMLNDRIRREGTRKLAAAAGAVGADRYLQQSVVWLARQPDGSAYDEGATPHPDRSTYSALDGERLAEAAGARHGFEVSILRCGLFYSHDSGQWREIASRLRDGRMPILGTGPLGRGDARLSLLHPDDAARAFVAAAEAETHGRWHVVGDEPATMAAVLRRLASLLDAPEPRRIPGWLARPLLGRVVVDLFTSPMATSNERFRAATGWEPELPTYREGLARVVARWEDEGFVHPSAGRIPVESAPGNV